MVIPLTLAYKLNSVCNAVKTAGSQNGKRTKINHKRSITLYIVGVKRMYAIYRNKLWRLLLFALS